jgi:hypothetical protein
MATLLPFQSSSSFSASNSASLILGLPAENQEATTHVETCCLPKTQAT